MFVAPSDTADVLIPVSVVGVQEAIGEFDRLRGSMNLLRGVVTQASITTFVFSMLMRRQRQTARRLQTVQENTAETIRKYGRFSLEATQALRRLEQAQESARFAQIEFGIQLLLSIGNITTLLFRLGDLVTQLGLVEAAYYAAAIAKAVFGGPAGVALLIATLGLVGLSIGSIVFGGRTSDAEFDQQWAEAGAYVRRERRRQRR